MGREGKMSSGHSSLPLRSPVRRSLKRRLADNRVNNKRRLFYLWSKRAFDLAATVVLGILVLPIIGAAGALIKIIDPGPAFYVQRRIGRDGHNIRIFKIRSMYRDSEERLEQHLKSDSAARLEWDRYFKLKNDPRVLPVLGRFIRRFSIDELPQLWNVIRGDMSLVGPRPFPPYHVKIFHPDVQRKRASVLPGLTGLWQISARSDGDVDVQQELDLLYIENASIWLDLYILLLTVPAVICGKGAR